jgi:hypothetical protein
MADPATMAIAGAAIGAATHKKNPLEGAMMGAALGGGGGYLLGGAGLGGAAAEGAAGAGAAEGLLGAVGPAQTSEFALQNPGYFYGPESNVGIPAASSPSLDFGANEMLDAELGKAQREAIAAKTRSFNPMMAMQAMNLTKPQEQPMMMRGGVTRGDPRAVQQDAVLSLLAPKRLEKRKISLMG